MNPEKFGDIVETLRALLAPLPKCHACDQPATRMMMSEHVPIVPGQWMTFEKGKAFCPRPFSGPSSVMGPPPPTDGTWQWQCCDEPAHAMPASMKPYGSWDHPTAGATRSALYIIGLNQAGEA